jgi:hypothetical protein
MNLLKRLLAVGAVLALAPLATASLTNNFQFNGNGNWSIDATGQTTNTSGPIADLRALVPTGSTVVAAFLYSTTQSNAAQTPIDVVFDGTTITGAAWTPLGLAPTAFGLVAFRADVTAQVAAKVGAGNDITPFTFSVAETNGPVQEGEALVVVYSNPAEAERTIALLDGFTAPLGDTTSINLANPLTAAQLADPNFEAQMSLGIGFGFQGSGQFSTVDVNGQRMTSSAGGQDDGGPFNGGLITVGDTFDDDFTTNPANPFGGPAGNTRTDDEAYNILPFLNAGITTITIDTTNPSTDDKIFFAGFNIPAVAGF